MGCGRGWRQPQLLKTGRPPEKGLLETLFTCSKFHPGQWSRHAFLNSTSKSVEVLSVSSWALPLGWAKTQVPQRPDTQIQPDGGCGWEHHSYCLSLISPLPLQSFVPLGWGSAESWQPMKKLCLEPGFCARGRARLPPLAGGKTGAWEFTRASDGYDFGQPRAAKGLEVS